MSPESPSSGGEGCVPSETNEFAYDWDRSTPPSLAVIESVAAATGQDPTELPPLAEVHDTDALDSLLNRAAREATSTTRISLTYAGCDVAIDSAGEVVVNDAAPTAGDGGTPGSASAFQAALKGLLADTHGNDVSVEGGWVCRNGREMPDYDVEITEITKPDDASERV